VLDARDVARELGGGTARQAGELPVQVRLVGIPVRDGDASPRLRTFRDQVAGAGAEAADPRELLRREADGAAEAALQLPLADLQALGQVADRLPSVGRLDPPDGFGQRDGRSRQD
jgi:hypothetical protein